MNEQSGCKLYSPASIAAPFGNYNHAALVMNPSSILFLSGQLGVLPGGEIPPTLDAQLTVIFSNIDACLHEGGMDRTHLVRLSTFLVRTQDREVYMAARDAYVEGPPPASTLIFVAGLARPEFLVEIEAVAAS